MKTPSKFLRNRRWIFPALALMFLIVLFACMEEPKGIIIPCNQPKGLTTFPANGDTGVSLHPVITVTFDTIKKPISFDSTSIILTHGTDTIGGSVFYQPTDSTLSFIPDDSLQPKQTYTVVINVPTDSTIPGPGGPLSPSGPPITVDTTYTWTFTTTDSVSHPPSPPAMEFPNDGMTGVPSNTHVVWYAVTNALSYHLQVSTNPLFTTTVLDIAGTTTTQTLLSQNLTGLTASTTYYWRVNATNSAGTSSWSSRSFKIAP